MIFCFGWLRLLKKKLLSIPPLGVVGFHPAALPTNRGRHPIIWALVLGLKRTASTFFFMGADADSGDILSQEEISILNEDDATSLYEKVTHCALAQIQEFVPQLGNGSYSTSPQDNSLSNIWRKRSITDGQVDWCMSAKLIHNLVRGLAKPYVGAHFLYRQHEIKIWKTSIVDDVPDNIEPGKILSTEDSCIIVKCGENAIRLMHTEPDYSVIEGEYL